VTKQDKPQKQESSNKIDPAYGQWIKDTAVIRMPLEEFKKIWLEEDDAEANDGKK
jgi:hypothetical protein